VREPTSCPWGLCCIELGLEFHVLKLRLQVAVPVHTTKAALIPQQCGTDRRVRDGDIVEQCLSAGVCHTALCLRACTIRRVCQKVCTIPYSAMSAGVYRTVPYILDPPSSYDTLILMCTTGCPSARTISRTSKAPCQRPPRKGAQELI